MSKPAFSDVFSIEGRRNRKSYFLISFVIVSVAFLFMVIAGLVLDNVQLAAERIIANAIYGAILVTAFVPFCFVTAQRCRDIGVSGWLAFMMLLPFIFIGGIFVIWAFSRPGTRGANKYGPDPLAPAPPA
jgi:uncharacterized membrane protein YhaH (DUF805 family)